ncbi:MAG: hypothetical protein ABJC09_01490, partial [Terriglobia bacterium]
GGGGGRGGGDSADGGGPDGGAGGIGSADSGGSGGGGRGGGGGGGGRGGGGGGEGRGSFGGAPGQTIELVVRWESAKPMLEVTKMKFPAAFDGHYALSVTGLPPQFLMLALTGGGRGRGGRGRGAGGADEAPQPPEDPAAVQKEAIDRLLHSVTLSAKSKDPEAADLVVQTGDKKSLVFGFPTHALPLGAGDKDIEFIMKLGGITVKAKFDAKDMSYKGELAI